MGKDSEIVIYCDSIGCQQVSQWTDHNGYRYCDDCKRLSVERCRELKIRIPDFRRRKGIISF